MNCEQCDKKLTEKQIKIGNRFCGRSCSAKWRMSQPEIFRKVHNPVIDAKRGKGRSEWLASGNPKAMKEIERIAALNPTKNKKTRDKISAILRKMKHGPHIRGGNGHGPTVPQRMLFDALGDGWKMEYIQKMGGRIPNYPTHYKIDIANDDLMIAIEVDGYSHKALKRQEKDRKKENKLAEFGWKVMRFKNKEILNNLKMVIEKVNEVINGQNKRV